MTNTQAQRRVAFFAFDWGDAAVRRRVEGFRRDGIAVDGFAMHRGRAVRPDWVVADLGETRDNAYLQRLTAIVRGARRAAAHRDRLSGAEILLARNLDMLATAFLARRLAGLKTPIVYECLDIHRLMVREDRIGRSLRRAEGWMLDRTAGLWVSSPAFLTEYFERYQPGRYRAELLENRMIAIEGLGPRPEALSPRAQDRPLRLGWFGNLRCPRSLCLMEALAESFGDRLEIVLRGYPALGEIPDFEDRVAACPGITYGGRYKAPEDLGDLYGGVDLVWAGDFMDAGFNSAWLLPNRLYEGGWFACPPIAPAEAQTGKWIAERGTGFTVTEPIEDSLPALIGDLMAERARITAAAEALRTLSEDTFLQPAGAMADLLDRAVADLPQ